MCYLAYIPGKGGCRVKIEMVIASTRSLIFIGMMIRLYADRCKKTNGMALANLGYGNQDAQALFTQGRSRHRVKIQHRTAPLTASTFC